MLQVRLQRIPGVTPKSVLRKSIIFGVILDDFEWQDSADWRDFTTVSAGQRTQAVGGKGTAGRNLRSLSMEVLTQWGHRLSFENARGSGGNDTRRELHAIVRTRAPFRFVATMNRAFDSDPAELRMDATIRSLTRRTAHGEPDSRYLGLEIVEYRSVTVDRRSRSKSDRFPLRHKLEPGDTLRSLAKHYWKHKGVDWVIIKRANFSLDDRAFVGRMKGLGPDDPLVAPGRYKAGDRIKIPEPPEIVSTPEGKFPVVTYTTPPFKGP